MSSTPLSALCRAALAIAVALLAAAPAAANAVRWSHLDDAASARPASGSTNWAAESNVKRTSGLALEPWRGNDSSWNRYSYVQNNPLAFVDPNGEETYVVVHGCGYTGTDLRGHNVGDLFRHAAETRAADIRASSEFDSAADSVVVVAAGNETEFADAVNADYASGPLKSIDVFSHGYEGGINFGEGGAGDTAKRMDIMEVNQLNPTMAPGASAQLYGCRTGLGDPSMAQAMANQLGVPVSGPTGPTWFTNPNPTAENPAVYQVPQGGHVVTYQPERPEEEPTP